MLGITAQASAQTVQNGSFSSTSGQPGTYTLLNGSTSGNGSLPNWGLSIAGGATAASNCLIIGDNLTAVCAGGGGGTPPNPGFSPDGGNFVDLWNGNAISQQLTLTPGQQYTLSFDQAGTSTGSGSSTVHWIVGLTGLTSVDSTSMNVTGTTSAAWNTFSDTFTAPSGNPTLTFTAYANFSGAASPVALIDGISLSAVAAPEPATLAVFGVGLAGLAAARRRRARREGITLH